MTDTKKQDKTFVCRCEDITLEDIVKAVDEGWTTLEEIKRYLGCGMGSCQGRYCMELIAKLVAKKTGQRIEDVIARARIPPKPRPPLKPVSYYVFLGEIDEDER